MLEGAHSDVIGVIEHVSLLAQRERENEAHADYCELASVCCVAHSLAQARGLLPRPIAFSNTRLIDGPITTMLLSSPNRI